MVCLKKEIHYLTFLHLQNECVYIIGNTTAFNETNIELSKATNFKANGKQKTSDNY